jgi:hypothetical protein
MSEILTDVSRRTLIKSGLVAAGVAGATVASVAGAAPAYAGQQDQWRWCNKCYCLFYSGNYWTGWCPKGGGHNWEGSGNYVLFYDEGNGQRRWRWCHKCTACWYSGHGSNKGECPAPNKHSRDGSGNYVLRYRGSGGGWGGGNWQDDWRWCRKCYCLWYSGDDQPDDSCAAGGRHSRQGSGNYLLKYV